MDVSRDRLSIWHYSLRNFLRTLLIPLILPEADDAIFLNQRHIPEEPNNASITIFATLRYFGKDPIFLKYVRG